MLPRQVNEDGLNPPSKWGQDREDSDTEDPDPEDQMPIPFAGTGPVPGKNPIRDSLRDWPDDDDDDCQILEVYDPLPFAFTYPLHPISADTEDQVIEVPPLAVGGRGRGGKKRAAPEGKKRAAVGISKRPRVAAKPRAKPMGRG